MTNKDIQEHLISLPKSTFPWSAEMPIGEVPLTEKDIKVINHIKELDRPVRMILIIEILDNPDIELETDVMLFIRENHKKEIMALRKANYDLRYSHPKIYDIIAKAIELLDKPA